MPRRNTSGTKKKKWFFSFFRRKKKSSATNSSSSCKKTPPVSPPRKERTIAVVVPPSSPVCSDTSQNSSDHSSSSSVHSHQERVRATLPPPKVILEPPPLTVGNEQQRQQQQYSQPVKLDDYSDDESVKEPSPENLEEPTTDQGKKSDPNSGTDPPVHKEDSSPSQVTPQLKQPIKKQVEWSKEAPPPPQCAHHTLDNNLHELWWTDRAIRVFQERETKEHGSLRFHKVPPEEEAAAAMNLQENPQNVKEKAVVAKEEEMVSQETSLPMANKTTTTITTSNVTEPIFEEAAQSPSVKSIPLEQPALETSRQFVSGHPSLVESDKEELVCCGVIESKSIQEEDLEMSEAPTVETERKEINVGVEQGMKRLAQKESRPQALPESASATYHERTQDSGYEYDEDEQQFETNAKALAKAVENLERMQQIASDLVAKKVAAKRKTASKNHLPEAKPLSQVVRQLAGGPAERFHMSRLVDEDFSSPESDVDSHNREEFTVSSLPVVNSSSSSSGATAQIIPPTATETDSLSCPSREETVISGAETNPLVPIAEGQVGQSTTTSNSNGGLPERQPVWVVQKLQKSNRKPSERAMQEHRAKQQAEAERNLRLSHGSHRKKQQGGPSFPSNPLEKSWDPTVKKRSRRNPSRGSSTRSMMMHRHTANAVPARSLGEKSTSSPMVTAAAVANGALTFHQQDVNWNPLRSPMHHLPRGLSQVSLASSVVSSGSDLHSRLAHNSIVLDPRFWRPAVPIGRSCLKGSQYALNHRTKKYVNWAHVRVTLAVPPPAHLYSYLEVAKDALWWSKKSIQARKDKDARQLERNQSVRAYDRDCRKAHRVLSRQVETMKADGNLAFSLQQLRGLLTPNMLKGLEMGYRGLELGGLSRRLAHSEKIIALVLDHSESNGNQYKGPTAKRRSRLNRADGLGAFAVEATEVDRLWAFVIALGDEIYR